VCRLLENFRWTPPSDSNSIIVSVASATVNALRQVRRQFALRSYDSKNTAQEHDYRHQTRCFFARNVASVPFVLVDPDGEQPPFVVELHAVRLSKDNRDFVRDELCRQHCQVENAQLWITGAQWDTPPSLTAIGIGKEPLERFGWLILLMDVPAAIENVEILDGSFGLAAALAIECVRHHARLPPRVAVGGVLGPDGTAVSCTNDTQALKDAEVKAAAALREGYSTLLYALPGAGDFPDIPGLKVVSDLRSSLIWLERPRRRALAAGALAVAVATIIGLGVQTFYGRAQQADARDRSLAALYHDCPTETQSTGQPCVDRLKATLATWPDALLDWRFQAAAFQTAAAVPAILLDVSTSGKVPQVVAIDRSRRRAVIAIQRTDTGWRELGSVVGDIQTIVVLDVAAGRELGRYTPLSNADDAFVGFTIGPADVVEFDRLTTVAGTRVIEHHVLDSVGDRIQHTAELRLPNGPVDSFISVARTADGEWLLRGRDVRRRGSARAQAVDLAYKTDRERTDLEKVDIGDGDVITAADHLIVVRTSASRSESSDRQVAKTREIGGWRVLFVSPAAATAGCVVLRHDVACASDDGVRVVSREGDLRAPSRLKTWDEEALTRLNMRPGGSLTANRIWANSAGDGVAVLLSHFDTSGARTAIARVAVHDTGQTEHRDTTPIGCGSEERTLDLQVHDNGYVCDSRIFDGEDQWKIEGAGALYYAGEGRALVFRGSGFQVLQLLRATTVRRIDLPPRSLSVEIPKPAASGHVVWSIVWSINGAHLIVAANNDHPTDSAATAAGTLSSGLSVSPTGLHAVVGTLPPTIAYASRTEASVTMGHWAAVPCREFGIVVWEHETAQIVCRSRGADSAATSTAIISVDESKVNQRDLTLASGERVVGPWRSLVVGVRQEFVRHSAQVRARFWRLGAADSEPFPGDPCPLSDGETADFMQRDSVFATSIDGRAGLFGVGRCAWLVRDGNPNARRVEFDGYFAKTLAATHPAGVDTRILRLSPDGTLLVADGGSSRSCVYHLDDRRAAFVDRSCPLWRGLLPHDYETTTTFDGMNLASFSAGGRVWIDAVPGKTEDEFGAWFRMEFGDPRRPVTTDRLAEWHVVAEGDVIIQP